MKRIMLLLFTVLVFTCTVQAQFAQRKVMLQQIAALQVYIEYAQKGYSIVSKGLNFIGDVKKGEVNLHNDYFISLARINPKVRKYYKVAQIIDMQFKIMKICKRTGAELKDSDLFHGDELDYVVRSFEKLLSNCSDTIDQLIVITTDSKLELKDDQRIARIDELYQTMLEDYHFSLDFSSEARLLALSKANEKREAESTTILYGL